MMMTTLVLLLTSLTFFPQESQQEVQTPERVSVEEGQSVTFSCVASRGIDYNMSWYQKKTGSAPKLLIYRSSYRSSGVPERFSGTNSGYNFTMTISKVQNQDAGYYYCMGLYGFSFVFIFGGGTKLSVGRVSRPTLSVLSSSSVRGVDLGRVTLVCLGSGGFPSDWTLSWKVDGSSPSSGVCVGGAGRGSGVCVGGAGVLKDGLYRWSSTLILTEDEWRKTRTVSCEARLDSHTPVTKSLSTPLCGEE